jgi:hypothetical protein
MTNSVEQVAICAVREIPASFVANIVYHGEKNFNISLRLHKSVEILAPVTFMPVPMILVNVGWHLHW